MVRSTRRHSDSGIILCPAWRENWYFDPAAEMSENDIQRMLAPLLHRGPDGNGVHLDRNTGLGHCRCLSLILRWQPANGQ